MGNAVTVRWHSFMAIGDSFTEGLDDRSADGTFRGWADRLAELMVAKNPDLQYANLAVRGKMMSEIVAEQLPIAVAARPDLVSLCAGGNDLIVPGADIDKLAAKFDLLVRELRAVGSEVLVFTGPDVTLPVVRAVRAKVALYNSHLWSIADQHGARVVDLWGMRVLRDPRAWSEDRLHFSPEGHHRIALRAAHVLALPATEPWDTPWPALAPTDWFRLRRKDISWAWTYLRPWAQRLIRGQSMGDGLAAKRPTLAPVQPTVDGGLAADQGLAG